MWLYVAQKLLKCYEKKPGDTAEQYVACLGEMAVQGIGDDLLFYTRQWMELVNRGGLIPLNDDAFRFFIEIELCVCIFLPEHKVTKIHSCRMYTIKSHLMKMFSSIGHFCHKNYWRIQKRY